jgi:hypothetical protein
MAKTRTSLAKQATDLRRNSIMELISTGYVTPRQISERLNLPLRTVYNDLDWWVKDAEEDTLNHFKSLSLELKKCYLGIDITIRELTDIKDDDTMDIQVKAVNISVLNSRMQAYKFKLDLLDGKAKLRQVFNMQNKTRVLTPQNTKVVIDGTP